MSQKKLASFDASFSLIIVFNSENKSNTMETLTEIPVLIKSKATLEKMQEPKASACCAPKNNASVCCSLSEKPEEIGGACCAQPADGSACCDK